MAVQSGRPPFRAKRPRSLAQQDLHLRHLYPSFAQVERCPSRAIWRGSLQPTETSPRYQVQIVYQLGRRPRVTVLSPPLVKNPPHVWSDGSLCLYRPSELWWDGHDLLAHTIVPWTAGWLFFYELWLDTGEWLGPEAPHTEAKKAA